MLVNGINVTINGVEGVSEREVIGYIDYLQTAILY